MSTSFRVLDECVIPFKTPKLNMLGVGTLEHNAYLGHKGCRFYSYVVVLKEQKPTVYHGRCQLLPAAKQGARSMMKW